MARQLVTLVLLGVVFIPTAPARQDKSTLLKEPQARMVCTGTVKIALRLNKILHLQVDVSGTQVQMQLADTGELDSATLTGKVVAVEGKPFPNVEIGGTVGGAPRSFPFVRVPSPKVKRVDDKNKGDLPAEGKFLLEGTVRAGTFKVQGETYTLQLHNATEPIQVTGKATDELKKREEIKGTVRLTGKMSVPLDPKNTAHGLLRMEAERIEFVEK